MKKVRRSPNKYSCPNNVPSHTDSDLTEIEIIEDLNPQKEPDIIDLTHLDDENEQNSGIQVKPNKNLKDGCSHKKYKKYIKHDSTIQTHEMGVHKLKSW